MGFITTVKILNDGFDQLQKNPEDFVDGIGQHMYDGGEFGVGNHANNVQVMKTQHADVFQLHSVYQNLAIELSPYAPETERLIERIPDEVRKRISQARVQLDRLEEMLPNEESEGTA